MKLIRLTDNAHILEIDNHNLILFSYETPIAAIIHRNAFITKPKSLTSRKHINMFRNELIITSFQLETRESLKKLLGKTL